MGYSADVAVYDISILEQQLCFSYKGLRAQIAGQQGLGLCCVQATGNQLLRTTHPQGSKCTSNTYFRGLQGL